MSQQFGEMIEIMHSDPNDDQQVLRLRFKDICDAVLIEEEPNPEDVETAFEVIKKVQETLCSDLTLKGTLKGYEEVQKVYAKKY